MVKSVGKNAHNKVSVCVRIPENALTTRALLLQMCAEEQCVDVECTYEVCINGGKEGSKRVKKTGQFML